MAAAAPEKEKEESRFMHGLRVAATAVRKSPQLARKKIGNAIEYEGAEDSSPESGDTIRLS